MYSDCEYSTEEESSSDDELDYDEYEIEKIAEQELDHCPPNLKFYLEKIPISAIVYAALEHPEHLSLKKWNINDLDWSQKFVELIHDEYCIREEIDEIDFLSNIIALSYRNYVITDTIQCCRTCPPYVDDYKRKINWHYLKRSKIKMPEPEPDKVITNWASLFT